MSRRYDLETVIKSEDAYKILQQIAVTEDEGNYAAQIARELDKNQNHIHNVMRPLREAKILLENEDKRAREKYYVVNHDALADLFSFLWAEELKIETDVRLDSENLVERIDQFDSIAEEVKSTFIDRLIAEMKLESMGGISKSGVDETLDNFVTDYTFYYFFNNEESTIRRMIVEDFYLGIQLAKLYDREPPEFLEEFRKLAASRNVRDAGRSVVDALDKTRPS